MTTQRVHSIDLNGKKLEIPSFFMISNLGGGGSDKYRETVYLDLYGNIPTLYNYYYLKYPDFAQKWISKIYDYPDFSTFISYVRSNMIGVEGYISNHHIPQEVDYKKTIYLLDSGAANIINRIVKSSKNTDSLSEILIDEMKQYYDFAHRFKFDLVVGFDRGGKYTFKGDERLDSRIIDANKQIDLNSIELNLQLLEQTILYLKEYDSYYPKVLATVHGDTPEDYKDYTLKILELEEKYDYKFFGFALGGVASSKGANNEWFKNLPSSQKGLKNQILVTAATKIVHSLVGDRPIHVLGGGGFKNIIPLSLTGATSYDSQSPGRRAYDGGLEGVAHVFTPSYSGNKNGSLSKYLIGRLNQFQIAINNDLDFEYYHLNKLDKLELCSCPACKEISSFSDIKTYYHNKINSALPEKERNEDYYYARQLCNSHGIWQHVRLTELMRKYNDIEMIKEIFCEDDKFIKEVVEVLDYFKEK